MKMKFWQKTYCAIVALFLACLCAVSAVSYRAAYQQSAAVQIEEMLTTQQYILQSFAQDMAALTVRRPEALDALYAYYAEQYSAEGLYFEIYVEGELVFTSTPKWVEAIGERPECEAVAGERIYLVRQTSEGRRLFSATAFLDSLEGVMVVCNTDLEVFYRSWEQMAHVLCVAVGAVGAVFSLLLYVLLSQLFRPLAVVTHTANALARGELSARAQVQCSDEFATLAQSMNGMAQALETQIRTLEKETRSKQQMLDHLAHEIRTPLAAISGWAQTMRDAALSAEEQGEALAAILAESERILLLSKKLLQLSALQHEAAVFTVVDMGALVERVCARAATKAAHKGVQLSQHTNHEQGARGEVKGDGSGDGAATPFAAPFVMQGDETLLESLLFNLVENAIKACDAGDAVTVRLRWGASGAHQLQVADTGRGMQPQTLAQIGTPFYREDKARTRSEGGAGLGVSLCLAIAQYHGAQLHYESVVQQGTVCTVTFSALNVTTSTQLQDDTAKPPQYTSGS